MNRCGQLVWIAALSGLAIASIGCSIGDVPAPTSFAKYNADNGDFAFEYPQGWDVAGYGKQNHVVEITKGAAAITVKSDLSGSLVGDIIGSGMGGMTDGPPVGELDEKAVEAMEDLEPVAQVHQLGQKELAEAVSNYSESKAEKVSTGLGEGRKSQFTGKQSLGREIRGFRVTVLARDKRVVVICSCPTSNWEALQPAFTKLIESLQYGQAKI